MVAQRQSQSLNSLGLRETSKVISIFEDIEGEDHSTGPKNFELRNHIPPASSWSRAMLQRSIKTMLKVG
jgi:hypothetical protein